MKLRRLVMQLNFEKEKYQRVGIDLDFPIMINCDDFAKPVPVHCITVITEVDKNPKVIVEADNEREPMSFDRFISIMNDIFEQEEGRGIGVYISILKRKFNPPIKVYYHFPYYYYNNIHKLGAPMRSNKKPEHVVLEACSKISTIKNICHKEYLE